MLTAHCNDNNLTHPQYSWFKMPLDNLISMSCSARVGGRMLECGRLRVWTRAGAKAGDGIVQADLVISSWGILAKTTFCESMFQWKRLTAFSSWACAHHCPCIHSCVYIRNAFSITLDLGSGLLLSVQTWLHSWTVLITLMLLIYHSRFSGIFKYRFVAFWNSYHSWFSDGGSNFEALP